MQYRFDDPDLEGLYIREEGASAYPAVLVDVFFDVISMIGAARDETDISLQQQRHSDQSSSEISGVITLVDSWVLCVKLQGLGEHKCVLIERMRGDHRSPCPRSGVR